MSEVNMSLPRNSLPKKRKRILDDYEGYGDDESTAKKKQKTNPPVVQANQQDENVITKTWRELHLSCLNVLNSDGNSKAKFNMFLEYNLGDELVTREEYYPYLSAFKRLSAAQAQRMIEAKKQKFDVQIGLQHDRYGKYLTVTECFNELLLMPANPNKEQLNAHLKLGQTSSGIQKFFKARKLDLQVMIGQAKTFIDLRKFASDKKDKKLHEQVEALIVEFCEKLAQYPSKRIGSPIDTATEANCVAITETVAETYKKATKLYLEQQELLQDELMETARQSYKSPIKKTPPKLSQTLFQPEAQQTAEPVKTSGFKRPSSWKQQPDAQSVEKAIIKNPQF
jgi:hypothetical protein